MGLASLDTVPLHKGARLRSRAPGVVRARSQRHCRRVLISSEAPVSEYRMPPVSAC